MNENIEKLKKQFGNYSAVARVIGITPRQFRNIRNGKSELTEPMAKLIEFICKEQNSSGTSGIK